MRLRDIKVFSPQWFKHWQGLLLLAVNFPVMGIREEVRHRLRIDQDGLPLSVPIYEIMANAYTVRIGGNEFQTTFRTHAKYAKRLYYEWKWIWELVHKWDTGFANKFIPQLNFGFDTLTKYPDAHTETNTVDGYVYYSRSAQTWATPHDADGSSYTNFDDASTTAIACGYDAYLINSSNCYLNALYRSIFLFNTSTILSTYTITDGVFSVGVVTYQDSATVTPDMVCVSSNPNSNTALQPSDYATLGTTAYSNTIAYSSLIYDYNNFTLNTSGKNAITKGGITKFGIRDDNDRSNTPFTSGTSGNKVSSITVRTADYSGTGIDPKLVATYTVPISRTSQMII